MKRIIAFGFCVAICSCGSKKNQENADEKPKDLKTQIEERMVELTCECLGPNASELEKQAYEAARDLCFQKCFPTILTEFKLTQETIPYKGSVELLAAFDRVKEGLAEKCPGKKK